MRIIVAFTLVLSVFASLQASGQNGVYQKYLSEQLPLLGHRNWIVIADSAYPAQTAAGIETVYTASEQRKVLAYVLEAVAKAPHVQPVVFVDKELGYVAEQDAAGIDQYRQDLKKLLRDHQAQSLPHEEIIAKLDEAGQTFKVLILKTNMTIPYTSVFLRLDCGYWSAEAEAALRSKMQQQPGNDEP